VTVVVAAARRLVTAAVTLAIVTLIVFVLLVALPGDAVSEGEGIHALPRGYRDALRVQYHLDEPVVVRYARWIRDVAHGELGTSFLENRPVAEIVRERLPVSIALNGAALAVMLLVATPVGIASAWKPGSRWDRAGALWTTALYAVPVFWMALVLQWLFAIRLEWLPLFGMSSDVPAGTPAAWFADRAAHLVLPVACLAYGGFAYVSRFVRTALVDATAGDGGRAVRARGAGPLHYLAVHGMRQASVPLLLLVGFLLPRLVGGSLLVEAIFNVPGLGSLLFNAVLGRDVPVVLALTLLSAGVTLAAVTIADVCAAWADPRVRRAG
jgi:peptide/nickel transport system permease protein